MKSGELINKAEAAYALNAEQIPFDWSLNVFSRGAIWMQKRMKGAPPLSASEARQYNIYGAFKYLLSIFASVVVINFAFQLHPAFLPLSILVFYLVEVHFLFLFPILIERKAWPLINSISCTYRVGVFTCMITVMQIAFYMLKGIFNFKDPFKNWHIGCLAVLIWYQDEVRDRI